MLKIIEEAIRQISREEVGEAIWKSWTDVLNASVQELSPDKFYILVIPTTIPEAEAKAAFEAFKGRLNLVILRADGVTLLELS